MKLQWHLVLWLNLLAVCVCAEFSFFHPVPEWRFVFVMANTVVSMWLGVTICKACHPTKGAPQ